MLSSFFPLFGAPFSVQHMDWGFSLGAAFVHQIHLNKMSYTTESGVNLVKSKSGSIIVKNIATCTYMIYEFVQ